MSSAPRPIRSGYSMDWAAEPPVMPPAPRKGHSSGLSRYLITFCIGIAATLAWQSYGNAAREIVSQRYPQFAWLAPPAPVAPPNALPSVTSIDPQEFKTISFGLAALRQRIDQLAANQDQISRDIATQLQQSRQEILDKISVLSPQPATPPARKPASGAPSH
jgi:hypothetical protein